MPTPGVNLTAREAQLIDETKPAAMAHLDADGLIELHTRVRRARDKFVDLYRRRGAAKVRTKGARGVAAAANERGWAKAEVFEDALARVSRQLAAASARNARDLKAERLAQARSDKAATPAAKSKAKTTTRTKADKPRKRAGRTKDEVPMKPSVARRQAKRDSR